MEYPKFLDSCSVNRLFKLRIMLVIFILFLSFNSFASPVSVQGDNMRVEVSSDPFALRVFDRSGREMLALDGPLSYTNVTGQRTFHFILYYFWTKGLVRPWTSVDKVVSIRETEDGLDADLGRSEDGPALVRLSVRFLDERTLKVGLEVLDQRTVNRFRIRLDRDDEDRYYGMGERYDTVEHSGNKVRVWTEEGGLGLFTLDRYWPDAPMNPFPKGHDMTYYPVPLFLNPDKNYAFLLDDVRYSLFNFGKTRPGKLSITNWNRRFDFVVFYGETPLELIEAHTAYTGRITVPKPWVFAPMNAVVHSEERVLEVADLLRREKIPTSAIWSESWWWRTEWEVNRELYPDYEQMIEELHRKGFRHLAYYQPYIGEGTQAYLEGDAKGYFIKNRKGETEDFVLGLWKKAQVDLTNPEAREWWKESFFQNSEDMGVDGWMHDFGEHIHPFSVAYDGRSGWELHNEYPLLWHKLGREFWDQARPDGDYFIYVRSGYTGAQKYVPVMWTGDLNTNFDSIDGLASNMPAILSVGLSGHPLCTTDIAGFNCFVSKDTDRELFMRWAELGALLPVMRIHRGQDEFCDNWSFDQDRQTLEHYKNYALLHTALFPYFYTLAHEAADKGWPVVRHMMLHYPDDPKAREQEFQFLVGDRILVAPVLERGAREWEVYLPEGEWVHWWTGKTYTGPARVSVPAELGELPMFVKAGKILPLFDSQIDTLVEEDRNDLNGWDDANSSMNFVFFGEGHDEYRLWDGTLISCIKEDGEPSGTCQVEDAPLSRSYAYEFK